MVKNNARPRFKFLSSIYGQVVFTITILSVFLFVSVGIIFRTVNERYLNSIIQHIGDNISSIVEGALYHSMLSNDRSALHNALDVLNTLPDIEDVNMYDSQDNLVYAPFSDNPEGHNNPNCKDCHANFNSMFPGNEKSFKIVNLDSRCEMSIKDYDYRLLMMKSPIMNEESCYTSSCHAHQESDEVLGSLVIRIPLEELDAAVNTSSRNFFVLASLTTLLLATFLLFFTRKKIQRPLTQIIKASEAISNGDTSTRLDMQSTQMSDIRLLSHAFNDMMDNLQSATDELQNWSHQLEHKVQRKSEELSAIQHELIHVERIASLGKLSSSVAHEINNPLSGVLTYTKLVHKQLLKLDFRQSDKEPMLKYLTVIEDETKRCGDIVKGLLDFSRKDQRDFKTYPLHNILKEAYILMQHQMKMENISFQTDFSASSDLIKCSSNQIKQACIALLLNAFEAVSEDGEILIRTSNPDDHSIKLEISDNGMGIAKEDIPQIFEPFFSTKDKASGIGLGLAIVHGIVQSHKGRIEVESQVGEGTSISIILPVVINQKQ
jgi:two-component system NtrC family sensor kinase